MERSLKRLISGALVLASASALMLTGVAVQRGTVPPTGPPSPAATSALAPADRSTQLAIAIQTDPSLRTVLAMAKKMLGSSGLNAGDSYPQTWIRDMNTFLPIYLEAGGSTSAARQAFLTLLAFQGADGAIPDGFVSLAQAGSGDAQIRSSLEPGYVAFTGTVESDQESSLVQAIFTYVSTTGDVSIMSARVGEETVASRLERAMRYLLTVKIDPSTHLVWSGVTVDWGDVQAGSPNPTVLSADGKRAVGIYTNAMLSLALRDLLVLPGIDRSFWEKERETLNANIVASLWDPAANKYRAHIYLNGSPFPATFDESQVNVHGGTAVAILAGLLAPDQVATSLAQQDADVAAAHANSIGITVWPAYPAASFSGPMALGQYQNAGDWDWFGARMVQALIQSGDVADAYRELKPMVARVAMAGNFYEWWDWNGSPQGSPAYRGAAGEMGLAILELLKSTEIA